MGSEVNGDVISFATISGDAWCALRLSKMLRSSVDEDLDTQELL
jgi:hypothetical protein